MAKIKKSDFHMESAHALKLLDVIVKNKQLKDVVEGQLGLGSVPEDGFAFGATAPQTVRTASIFLDHLSAAIKVQRDALAGMDHQSELGDLQKPKRGPGRPKKDAAAEKPKAPAARRTGRPQRSKSKGGAK